MIETKNLTKTFDNFTAVDSLDLKIETGEFFGLLGPNGAGKTTTISLLSTLLLPTKGEILDLILALAVCMLQFSGVLFFTLNLRLRVLCLRCTMREQICLYRWLKT